MPSPAPPVSLTDLRAFSARIGADCALIQGAGGNTSLKAGDTMWIKASGTLLATALERDIMVPVDRDALAAALAADAASTDDTGRFVVGEHPLRPSIETSLHAVLPQAIVVHVHCVDTIAHVIRRDAAEILAPKLAGLDWILVPYQRPGARLAAAVRDALRPGTDVVVLANHGLIVAADSVAEAEALLADVTRRLAVDPGATRSPDGAALEALAAGSAFAPAEDDATHQVALDPAATAAATGGSLYPDHVIFCGIGTTALAPLETPAGAAARAEAATGLAPPLLLVPGHGVLLRRGASAGTRALARCLSDVVRRLPPGAPLRYLTHTENHELLDWDAEKYRRALDDA